jgi:hypothetical protein
VSRPATSQVLKRFSWQLDGQLNAILLQLHAVNEKLQRTGCFDFRAKAAAPCTCGVVAARCQSSRIPFWLASSILDLDCLGALR